MRDKFYVTREEFTNLSYDEIINRGKQRLVIDKFMEWYENTMPENELAAMWDKVRRDPVRWRRLVKEALK